jgi:hypothetical protein
MKKTIALLLGLAIFAGAAAPSMAQATWKDCPFTDKSMCVMESIQSHE